MCRPLLLTLAFFLAFTAAPRAAEIRDLEFPIPPRKGFVNDYAELLSIGQRARLEALLSDFERQTSCDVVVATFPTFGDRPLESFMLELANQWKLGYKDVGNGVVFAVFKKEAQAAVETGTGLADQFPLSFRKKLIQQSAAPQFRRGNYDHGTELAVRKMIRKIDPVYSVENTIPPPSPPFRTEALWIGFILILSFLLDARSYFAFRNSMSKTRGYAYWRETGRYSFTEWWLLYGIIPSTLEYFYFHFFRRWLNPGFLISSEGAKTALLHFRTGRGRFFGNGTFGSW